MAGWLCYLSYIVIIKIEVYSEQILIPIEFYEYRISKRRQYTIPVDMFPITRGVWGLNYIILLIN